MGYQQKRLLISGMIALAVPVLAGLQKLHAETSDSYFRQPKLDLLGIAAKAQPDHHQSQYFQGGINSFEGLSADEAGLKRLTVSFANENGSFSIVQITLQQLLLPATGKDDYDGDGQNMTVQMIVFPDIIRTTVISR